jgi:hypothetical protein
MTQNEQYVEQQKFWKSVGRALSLWVIPWHLPYNLTSVQDGGEW